MQNSNRHACPLRTGSQSLNIPCAIHYPTMLLHSLSISRNQNPMQLPTTVLHLHGIRISRRWAALHRLVSVRHLRAGAERVLHVGKLLRGQLVWWDVRRGRVYLVGAPLDGAVVETPVGELVAIVCKLGHLATVAAEVEHDEDDDDYDECDDTVCRGKRVC